jgi:hypothetical protein
MLLQGPCQKADYYLFSRPINIHLVLDVDCVSATIEIQPFGTSADATVKCVDICCDSNYPVKLHAHIAG